MNLRTLACITVILLAAVAAQGSFTGQTSAAWQVTFFVMMTLSVSCLVADRQRPI